MRTAATEEAESVELFRLVAALPHRLADGLATDMVIMLQHYIALCYITLNYATLHCITLRDIPLHLRAKKPRSHIMYHHLSDAWNEVDWGMWGLCYPFSQRLHWLEVTPPPIW